ncbi:MAG: adenylate kinase family protein [Candidatus Methylarchaceae archaeon HK01B]|nr:adenylate kinase family protein [Candidatus Methylarchaceae archaeon HK01M]MCP8319174.1 adenylate kinase family protein [Candidatus Methylarchaceae archaeon HK01B]
MGKFYQKIGITGNPGTGKKTAGRSLAKLLNYNFLDLNQLAIEKYAIIDEDEHGFIADLSLLRKYAKEAVKGKSVVVVGHLLPFVLSKKEVEFIVVLRCSPFELEKRYSSRNYSEKKVKENIASEILGICAYEALKKFGRDRIAEFDTTGRDADKVAGEIIKVIKGNVPKRVGYIDWLQPFTEGERLSRFFD